MKIIYSNHRHIHRDRQNRHKIRKTFYAKTNCYAVNKFHIFYYSSLGTHKHLHSTIKRNIPK